MGETGGADRYRMGPFSPPRIPSATARSRIREWT